MDYFSQEILHSAPRVSSLICCAVMPLVRWGRDWGTLFQSQMSPVPDSRGISGKARSYLKILTGIPWGQTLAGLRRSHLRNSVS